MPKILNASCFTEIVRIADTVPVVGAEILSEGISPSTGVLIIDDDKSYYIAKTSPDLKATLDIIGSLLTQLQAILSGLDANSTNPGAQAAAIIALTVHMTALGALKETLR